MDTPLDWLAAFTAHLPDATALAHIPSATLEKQLFSLYGNGKAAWPGVLLPLQDFFAHLGTHCNGEGELTAFLASVQAADLYLAAACAQGIPAALRAFDEHFLSRLPTFLTRLRPADSFIEEMRQVLREKLLVATPGKKPKIAEYSGRGSLLGWVRVTAVRTAISARRNKDEILGADSDDLSVDAFAAEASPEMDYLKTRYRKEFQTAFHSALEKLTAEQRNLLRLHFVDGLNIEKIGALLHVHRATIARWIAAAREQILDNVQRDLHQRLHLGQSEFDSLVNLVRSQLHVSILRFLTEKQP